MLGCKHICGWILALLIALPTANSAGIPVPSVVIFGDSMSDIGNTTHLLKSLRQEEHPAYIIAPLKIFVINKMNDFANEYYVPQMVLDAGVAAVTDFFDNGIAPYITDLIARVKLVPVLPGQPYWNSRFSNGPVWNEYLPQMASLPITPDAYVNRAFGGSWAVTYDYQLTVWNLIRHPLGVIKSLIVGKLIPPSLGISVQAYLLEHQHLNNDTLYFLFSGGNDYLNALAFEDNYDEATMSGYIDNVLDGLAYAVFNLQRAGAERFVIMGLPWVGNTPKFAYSDDKEVLNFAVFQHNQRLVQRIEEWKQLYPQVDFLYIDTQEYLAKALANPSLYGFRDVTTPCIDVVFPMLHELTASVFAHNSVLNHAHRLQSRVRQEGFDKANYHACSNPDNYLFWDEVHPTAKAHRYLALEICQAMKNHGYEMRC